MLLPRKYYQFLSFMIYLICNLLAVFTFTLAPCLYKLEMVKTFFNFFFVPENSSFQGATVLHLDQSNRGPPHQSGVRPDIDYPNYIFESQVFSLTLSLLISVNRKHASMNWMNLS